jgi:hypothetical protein
MQRCAYYNYVQALFFESVGFANSLAFIYYYYGTKRWLKEFFVELNSQTSTRAVKIQ